MRCFGDNPGQELLAAYHDNEWGIPQHDDTKLFELLLLEGAQAGLSWETVLKKREAYRKLFHHFNISKVAAMDNSSLEALMHNSSIIRNRLKIFAFRKNAQAALKIKEEFGSLDHYFWGFVNNKPIVNHFKTLSDIPSSTPTSITISKDLKKRKFTFVGPTIVYAFMQAAGLVCDHFEGCLKYYKNS